MNYKTYRAMTIAPEIEALMESAIDETGEIVNEVALSQADELIKERTVLLTDLAAWVKWAEQIRITEIDSRIEQLRKDRARFEKAIECMEFPVGPLNKCQQQKTHQNLYTVFPGQSVFALHKQETLALYVYFLRYSISSFHS